MASDHMHVSDALIRGVDATPDCSVFATPGTSAQYTGVGLEHTGREIDRAPVRRNCWGLPAPTAADDEDDAPIAAPVDEPDWSDQKEAAIALVERETDAMGLSELADVLRFQRHLKTSKNTMQALAAMLLEEVSQ